MVSIKKINSPMLLFMAIVMVIAITMIAKPLWAMRVSPMVIEMESRGANSVARVEVQNINAGNLAFETRVFRMELDKFGNITETPADEEFLIFPPQGILPTSGRQVVRLQWLGDPEPPTSQAYYVSIQQLPVRTEPGSPEELGAQVQILYNLRPLVVVAPPGAQPDVKAASVKQANFKPKPINGVPTPDLLDGVEITLKNDGRRHAMMSNFTWKLVGKDRNGEWLRVDVSPEDLSQAIGTGFIPAQSERTFQLPVSGFNNDPIALTFK